MRAVLFVSGLVAVGIGGSILLVPEAFYASYGIDLSGNINLLNEMRAAGGAVLASGLLILSGAFVARFAWLAALVGCLTYIPYGLSRGLAVLLDGAPDRGSSFRPGSSLQSGRPVFVVLLRDRSHGPDRPAIRSARA